jgi:hypothetical protein
MGKAAVVFAKNEFNPETQNGRYLKLYEKLIEDRRQATAAR